MKFVNSDDWWNSHFYPNIADGENGFYGKNQADWGTGGKLFDELELQKRSNIVIRENEDLQIRKGTRKVHPLELVRRNGLWIETHGSKKFYLEE